MTPDEVLDQIDHALQDWDVSPDAMRWTPDEPPATSAGSETRGVYPDMVAFVEETHILVLPAPAGRRPRAGGHRPVAAAVPLDDCIFDGWPPAAARGAPVAVGFDGGALSEASVAGVIRSVDDTTTLRRIWLNTWTTDAPGEGAR